MIDNMQIKPPLQPKMIKQIHSYTGEVEYSKCTWCDTIYNFDKECECEEDAYDFNTYNRILTRNFEREMRENSRKKFDRPPKNWLSRYIDWLKIEYDKMVNE
jgi:hypothetical protein